VQTRNGLVSAVLAVAPLLSACGDDDDRPAGDTTYVGVFDGLFEGVATGFNFPFDTVTSSRWEGVLFLLYYRRIDNECGAAFLPWLSSCAEFSAGGASIGR
jgi:hypothetical protein